jgi:hypothetical protein
VLLIHLSRLAICVHVTANGSKLIQIAAQEHVDATERIVVALEFAQLGVDLAKHSWLGHTDLVDDQQTNRLPLFAQPLEVFLGGLAFVSASSFAERNTERLMRRTTANHHRGDARSGGDFHDIQAVPSSCKIEQTANHSALASTRTTTQKHAELLLTSVGQGVRIV